MLSVNDAEMVGVCVIVAASAIHMPCMSASIGSIEMWASEVEVVTSWVVAIDAEVPIACLPVEWTIEIGGCEECVPLPVEQYVAQIEVTALPIGTKHVVTPRYTHQIVEIDLVGSLVLFVSQIQFICHLIR